MKKLQLLLILALSAIPALACTGSGGNSACVVSGVFSDNFATSPAIAVCSVSVTTNCFLDWKVGVIAGSAFSSQATIPAPASISGPVIGVPYSFPFTAPTNSTVTVAVIWEIKDPSGVVITSDPTLSTAQAVSNAFPAPTIAPATPSAVTATAK